MLSLARLVALSGSSEVVRGAPSVFRGVGIHNSHATDSVTLVLYDNASAASGTIVAAHTLAAGASADTDSFGVWCENGIYASVSGTGTLAGSVRIG